MYLPSAFRLGILLVLQHALLVAGEDFAYVQAALTNMTASWSSIKTTAQAINTTDYPFYALGSGNYKSMETQLEDLATDMNEWNAALPGTTITDTTQIDTIVALAQALASQMSLALSTMTSKSGLFSTTPVVGQPIVSAIESNLYSFISFAGIIRTLSPSIASRVPPLLTPVWPQFYSTANK
ncbi:hypothetical protein V8F20_001878 [Naviculisporaceae sp. PSN 640]